MFDPKTGDVKLIDFGMSKAGLEYPNRSKEQYLEKSQSLEILERYVGRQRG